MVKYRTGHYIDKSNSNWYDPKTKKFKYQNIIPILGITIPGFLTTVVISYAFQYAGYADMNAGIIPSLFLFGTLYNALIFYFLFGQTLSIVNLIGIVLMVVSALMFCLDSS